MQKVLRLLVLSSLIISISLLLVACGNSKYSRKKPAETNANETRLEEAKKAVEKKDEATQKQIVIKVAHYFPNDHPQNKALNEVFKKIVEEESKGAIFVEVYGNNTLGSEKEFAEGTKIGSIEMSVIGVILSDQFVETKLLEFPYLFESVEEGIEILNKPDIKSNLSKRLSKVGLKSLGYSVNGRRVITNSKKPIYSIEDCKDIVLRVPPPDHFLVMGNAMGFKAVSVPMPEVFTALQQRVVDGVENPPATILSSGWYEVQKYLALTWHMTSFNDVIINEKFYNSLSNDHKQIIEKAVQAYFKEETRMYLEAENEVLKKLQEAGLKITTPPREPFVKAMHPVFEKYCRESKEFNDTLKLIREVQKK